MPGSGRPDEATFGVMHIAESNGQDRRNGSRHPKKSRCRLEMAILLFARQQLEPEDRDNDADGYMQYEDVKTSEKVNQLHGSVTDA